MKKIEFRVWDKKDKSMHIVISLHHPNYLDCCEYAVGQSSDAVRSVRYKDCKVMQFIGVIDKNKKLIYEGDIVKLYCGCIGQIKFDYGEFDCYMSTKEASKHSSVCNKKDSITASWKWEPEVIGNIYENKKLLDEKNESKKA